uniref:Uncharacterized protein n=1 Tax=Megaselia scalaris TaxID=36166 RepID=T1GLC6_MEGSC
MRQNSVLGTIVIFLRGNNWIPNAGNLYGIFTKSSKGIFIHYTVHYEILCYFCIECITFTQKDETKV